MEAIVDSANMQRAWDQVRGNRGAPGPDGITLTQFPEWFRPQWAAIRQQLLDGSYEPSPVRRKTIDKPDGGQRQLGYLRAGVMVEGVLQSSPEGTPQGGPLSPLPSRGCFAWW